MGIMSEEIFSWGILSHGNFTLGEYVVGILSKGAFFTGDFDIGDIRPNTMCFHSNLPYFSIM